jgi:hypothetical protein
MLVRSTMAAIAVLLVLVPAPASAQDETPSTQFLGPFEFAPQTLMGNLAAPRAATPETRLGVALQWRRDSSSFGAGDLVENLLGLLVEAHLEMFDFLEIGVDFEIFNYHGSTSGGSTSTTNDFGFITPRIKVLVLPLGYLDIAVGTGVLLPTTTYEFYESNLPVAFDPGAYIAYRPLPWISINATVPFIFWFMVPDTGDTTDDYFFAPTLGATLMPLDFIGGFADLQFYVWMNPESPGPGLPTPEPLRILNLMAGVRSRPIDWLFLEAGVIVPLAGQQVENSDIGFGARISATPDFL